MDRQATTQEQMEQPSLASLFGCWKVFQDHLHPDELVHQVLEVMTQVTGSSTASLMLLDEDDQTLRVKAAVGLPQDIIGTAQVRLGEGIAGWVAKNRRPLMLPDGSDIPVSVRESMLGQNMCSSLCLPLSVGTHLLGVVHLTHHGDEAPFRLEDLWFASLLAERLAVALDIARFRDEQARQLQARERFIRDILKSIPSSLLVIDRSMRVVSANRNFLLKAKRDEESTLGHRIEEVFPRALMEYTQLDRQILQVFRSGQPVEGGKLAYRAPGLPNRVYYYRLVPIKGQSGVESVLLLMDDITEREQLGREVRLAERHLASVVDCANDLVISLNRQGRILTWNVAAEHASGLKMDQVNGQTLLSFCASRGQSVMADMLQKLTQGERVRNVEANLTTSDGREIPISWSCSAMREDGGEVVGIVAVGRDLTERRSLEAQLIQSAKMASLGVMAGGIAHEVRNPLGIIAISAQLLRERFNDPELPAGCLERIDKAVKRASLIIENLLKFARASREQMEKVDVHAVLDETLALLANQISLQKVALKKDFQPDLPTVYGNPDLLQQVFANLALNARNAMPEGGTLVVTTRSSRADQVELQFSDTGCGIPSENLPKIFDPFFTTRPVGQGTGLGLSICYSIVQQHRGTIEVQSQPGEGTTVTVRLPSVTDDM